MCVVNNAKQQPPFQVLCQSRSNSLFPTKLTPTIFIARVELTAIVMTVERLSCTTITLQLFASIHAPPLIAR